MKSFFQYCGIFLTLIGVLLLVVAFFLHIQTNRSLLTAWILIVSGFVLFIGMNRARRN